MGATGDWNAGDYAANSSAQFSWALDLIGKLGLTGNESVLDLGCGDGKVTAEMARRLPGGRVVGIDPSPDMIRKAKAAFTPQTLPNAEFREMDARVIRVEGPFDVVFSNAVLHWVDDLGAVLNGTYSVLKQGGRFLFQSGGRGNAEGVKAVVDEVAGRRPFAPYFRGFSFRYYFRGPDECLPLLASSGFRTVRCELIPRDMTQWGREGFAGWFRTTWFPWTDTLPDELSGRFIEEVLDRYLELHPVDGEGLVHTAMVRLETEALKP